MPRFENDLCNKPIQIYTMSWQDRHCELLRRQEIAFVRQGKIIMREYGKIIIPLGPACQNKELFKDFSSKRLSKLNGKLIWWSYKSDHTSSWYAVVRKAYFPIAEYKK